LDLRLLKRARRNLRVLCLDLFFRPMNLFIRVALFARFRKASANLQTYAIPQVLSVHLFLVVWCARVEPPV
jgi:hypothetical protein